MENQVLFIQGAGEGAYQEDEKLAASLQAALGTEYHVVYPKMPDEESPDAAAWIARISQELAALKGQVILVGHSAGGATLLQYLVKEKSLRQLPASFSSRFHIGVLKMSKVRNTRCVRALPHNFLTRCRFTFTIVVTTNGSPLRIWQSMRQKFHKPPCVNSTGAGISSTMIYRTLPPISSDCRIFIEQMGMEMNTSRTERNV